MRSVRRVCALAFGALLAAAISAPAQVTTGSVSGTVKDAQGGVVPGATVVLISEGRGTRSEPATTSATGDFVFPERHRRHLRLKSRCRRSGLSGGRTSL